MKKKREPDIESQLIKVTVHFQRMQLCHFHCFCFSLLESTLKATNLVPMEQILSSKSRPHYQRASLSSEENRKLQKLFPLVKVAEQYGGATRECSR